MLCVQAFQCKYVKTVSITHNVSHPRLTININNIRRWCMFSVVVTNKKIVYISLITTKSNVLINNQRPSTVYTANMIYIGNEQIIFWHPSSSGHLEYQIRIKITSLVEVNPYITFGWIEKWFLSRNCFCGGIYLRFQIGTKNSSRSSLISFVHDLFYYVKQFLHKNHKFIVYPVLC